MEKDTYKYFKYPLELTEQNSATSLRNQNVSYLENFTIELKEFSGASKLFFSFDEKNPKSDSDFLKANDKPERDENFYDDSISIVKYLKDFQREETESLPTTESNNLTLIAKNSKYYQVKRGNNSSILYLSVKGFETENMFQVYVYNRTVNFEMSIHQKNSLVYLAACLLVAFLLL